MDDRLLVEQREHGIVEAVDTKQVLNVVSRMRRVSYLLSPHLPDQISGVLEHQTSQPPSMESQ